MGGSTVYTGPKCWPPFSNLHFHVAYGIAAVMGRVHICKNPTVSTA